MIDKNMTIKYNGKVYNVVSIVRDEFMDETFYIVDLTDSSGSAMITTFDHKTEFEVIDA